MSGVRRDSFFGGAGVDDERGGFIEETVSFRTLSDSLMDKRLKGSARNADKSSPVSSDGTASASRCNSILVLGNCVVSFVAADIVLSAVLLTCETDGVTMELITCGTGASTEVTTGDNVTADIVLSAVLVTCETDGVTIVFIT